ncbi:hypothetical protein DUI87_18691 [Hirundo rustica rustica]|uniref:Uncharacterized protein n=1 Tax=Hirundo rustica rustica TaxID=333673 RepID=A0A3M0JXK5_HIRRU|nr:hypothetical protein DUI87_18691 [Hirundo rustica rustica]
MQLVTRWSRYDDFPKENLSRSSEGYLKETEQDDQEHQTETSCMGRPPTQQFFVDPVGSIAWKQCVCISTSPSPVTSLPVADPTPFPPTPSLPSLAPPLGTNPLPVPMPSGLEVVVHGNWKDTILV